MVRKGRARVLHYWKSRFCAGADVLLYVETGYKVDKKRLHPVAGNVAQRSGVGRTIPSFECREYRSYSQSSEEDRADIQRMVGHASTHAIIGTSHDKLIAKHDRMHVVAQ